jgi:hypothetical protein
MLAVLVLLVAVPGDAWARGCSLAAGIRGSAAAAGRDWDLATPRGTVGVAPSVSARCHGRMGFFGVDATPGLRHGYRDLNARGPMAMNLSLGVGRGPVGAWMLSNGAVRAFGLYGIVPLPNGTPLWIRTAVIPGPSPTWIVDIQGSWDTDPDGERNRGAWDPSIGVEIGTVFGLRADAMAGWIRPGVRLAVLHRQDRDVLLSPTALGTVVAPLVPWNDGAIPFVEVAAGARWTGSEAAWVSGGSVGLSGVDGRYRAHIGALVLEPASNPGTDRVQVVFDAGLTLMVF